MGTEPVLAPGERQDVDEVLRPASGAEPGAGVEEPIATSDESLVQPVDESANDGDGDIAVSREREATLQEPESNDPLLGITIAHTYRLVRRLGCGGMGAVYLAESESGDPCAVKVVLPDRAEQNPRAERRFVREARALLELDHPNIVKVVDAGIDLDRYIAFIAMERLEGEDLGRLLARVGPLDPAATALLFLGACKGLGAAHERGLVHRDVKPSNLFLHELASGTIQPKLCDFGAVTSSAGMPVALSTEELTRTGNVVGSPLFMSPEQALGAAELDVRTDVWSLGVSLYCALTGRTPWRGTRTLAEIFVSICTAPVPHVQDAAPWVPCGLAEVVHRALRRDRGDRYPSASALGEALEPFAAAGPLTREMLEPVSDATRGRVADRAAGPATATLDAAGMSHTLADAASGVRRPSASWRLAALAGSVALVAALAWLTGPGGGSRLAEAQTRTAIAGRSARDRTLGAAMRPSGVVHASVIVVPEDVSVAVDGAPYPLEDGRVHLHGEPGDTFELVVSRGERSATKRVVLTKLGTAAPDRFDLVASLGIAGAPPADTAARDTSAQPGAPRPTAVPTDRAVPLARAARRSEAHAPTQPTAAEPLAPIETW